MKIAFWEPLLAERGTSVALYDYAFYNEKILNNVSLIITKKTENAYALDKFTDTFQVVFYEDFSEVDDILARKNVDVLYTIKSGERDTYLSKKCKTIVHCVFTANTPHGDVYAAISPMVANISDYDIPVVPHIVTLPDHDNNLREQLRIPEDATVFGRYGGLDTFDIKFVHKTVTKIVRKRPDLYFLFMNTNPFYKTFLKSYHKQIIHLDKSVDLTEKTTFINTCDAMLHARHRGETFGLSVGEFSIRNKPVITWGKSREKAHLDILKDKGFVYNNKRELYSLLFHFDKDSVKKKNWDAYSQDYNPQTVMDTFQRIFLH